jgi:phosphotransferase family enzyme
MSIDPLFGEACLRQTLQGERASLGVGDDMRIQWIYNPGNFANAHYRILGASRDLHVKLVEDPSCMDLWYGLRDRLLRDYRAPDILARLEIPQASLTAYVFPHLPGRAPEPDLAGPVIREVGALLARLHADYDLAGELAGDATLLSSFQTGLLECLSEDLIAIRAHPEVSRHYDESTMAWLAAEAEALREEGRRRIPDEPVRSPIHSDPWILNLLVHGQDWRLLDWDGLRLGDPAGDWAMLLFDAWVDGAEPEDFLPPDPDLRERVRLHLRAASFDAIVDPLSDLTEMPPNVPHADTIRAAKCELSKAALLRYRRLYP